MRGISPLFFIVLFLLVVPFSFADKITQLPSAENTLTISYPKNEYYLINSPSTLDFHVFNSTAYLLTNLTTSCNIHIYNETGDHLLEEYLNFDKDEMDFFIDLPSNIYQRQEVYSYLLSCNNSNEAGFVSTSFEINTDSPDNSAGIFLIIIILLPMIFGFFLLLGSFFLSEDHNILKIFLFLLSLITFFASFHAGLISIIRFYNFTEMENFIGDTTFWIGLTFAVIMIYFIIYLIVKMFDSIAKNKDEELEY